MLSINSLVSAWSVIVINVPVYGTVKTSMCIIQNHAMYIT